MGLHFPIRSHKTKKENRVVNYMSLSNDKVSKHFEFSRKSCVMGCTYTCVAFYSTSLHIKNGRFILKT